MRKVSYFFNFNCYYNRVNLQILVQKKNGRRIVYETENGNVIGYGMFNAKSI